LPRNVWVGAAALVLLAATWPDAEPLPGRWPPDPIDTAWLLAGTALCGLGLAAFPDARGAARAAGAAALAWVVVGFSLAFGPSWGGLMGDPLAFAGLSGVSTETDPILAPSVPLGALALFHLAAAAVCGRIASVGSSRPGLAAALYVALVHAPVVHWTHHPAGWLRDLGLLDRGGLVLLAAACTALGSTLAAGREPPRAGPLVVAALGLSLASPAGPAVALSFAAGAAAGAAIGGGTGALAAAAALSVAGGFVPLGAAVVIGLCAAALARPRAELAIGAVVGALGVGLLGSATVDPLGADGLRHGNALTLAWQALGALLVASWAYALPFFGVWGISRIPRRVFPSRTALPTGTPVA
jgi:Amt family ammonium transporter